MYKSFPTEEDRVRPNRVLSRELAELGIAHLDLLPHFRAREGDFLYNMVPNGHLSVAGNQAVAEILYEVIGPAGSPSHQNN